MRCKSLAICCLWTLQQFNEHISDVTSWQKPGPLQFINQTQWFSIYFIAFKDVFEFESWKIYLYNIAFRVKDTFLIGLKSLDSMTWNENEHRLMEVMNGLFEKNEKTGTMEDFYEALGKIEQVNG